MTITLTPITSPAPDTNVWAGATWIGQIDEEQIGGERVELSGAESFERARLLVWSGSQPRGFVEVPVERGVVDTASLRDEVTHLPIVVRKEQKRSSLPISVVVCTRDRPEQLREVLKDLVELQYPLFEVAVVDNNPASGLTPPVVESFDNLDVTLLSAVGQGLAIARNTALKNAKYSVVAFTDDDVVVDPNWLTNLAHGFSRDERVACVCGIVPSAELATPAQSYFDQRVGWARRCDPAVYSLADPPNDDPLFPFRVAQFGTGANFAVRRDVVVALGGFDEGMGIGSPTGGGEDIDMFVRILLAGESLVREPSAVVWHRHRKSTEDLETQIYQYGLGLGAWITKLVSRPRTLGMVLRRLRPGIRHLRGVTVVDQSDTVANDPRLLRLDRRELGGVLTGPFALARSRVSGRRATPLKTSSSKLLRAFDFRRGQMWGDSGNSIAAGRLALTAAMLGLIGSLGAARSLPTALLAISVGAFVLIGPGSLVMSWYTKLPTAVLVTLVPSVSIAVCLLVVTGLLMAGIYSPVWVLLGLTGVTVMGGLVRCGLLARRKLVTAS